ncbi:MAG: putative sugar nucleotidyl transferase [Cyclobacteriaceae bacterium]
MQLVLFDLPSSHSQLLPLTYTRPIADLRIGIYTIADKWSLHLNTPYTFLTQDYLQKKFSQISAPDEKLYINGAVLPNKELIKQIKSLKKEKALFHKETIIAYKSDHTLTASELLSLKKESEVTEPINTIDRPWNLFQLNGQEIKADFSLATEKRTSSPLTDKHTICYNEKDIFIEEGVSIKASVLDATRGPIYIDKHAIISIGAVIEGPTAIGKHATIKSGAKIRAGSTIGTYSKIGGEVSNVIIQGYSNKGHDGFLGNAVIGEWCNLGADTNASNMKNNYSIAKAWDYKSHSFISTGIQFCGLLMGDHSKAGINTMFNTATMVGICSNIFGSDFPEKFIPSFSWGSKGDMTTFRLEKVFEMAENMMARKNISFSDDDKKIISHVFNITSPYRK